MARTTGRRNPFRAGGPESGSTGGFTLIELLAVMAIILILITFLLPRITTAIDQGKVTACKANLIELYKQLFVYDQKHGDLPKGSGVQFFAAVIADGDLENTAENAKKMSCPAVKASSLTGVAALEDAKEWYKHIDQIDGSYSAYAGRNMKQFPLRRFPGSGEDPLIADDNDPEMNHPTTTCVLWADGSVTTIELLELRKKGLLTEDDTVLKIGPDSPVESLRKLSTD
jgi:prepilin-type N-terminal cleavage/methylation domain-containing protein